MNRCIKAHSADSAPKLMQQFTYGSNGRKNSPSLKPRSEAVNSLHARAQVGGMWSWEKRKSLDRAQSWQDF